MADKTRQPPQGALAARLQSEFMAVVAEILGKPLYDPHLKREDRPEVERPYDLVSGDPDFAGFALEGFDPTPEGGFMARCAGIPQGQRNGFEGYTYPERQLVVEAVARVLEVRSRRMGDDGIMAPVTADWRDDLKTRYPGWLKHVSFEHGDGWGDMQVAMFAWLDEALDAGEKAAFHFDQIKEKFGGLRAYHVGQGFADTICDTMEYVSEATCDTCGAPGHLRNDRGWMSTRCDDHAPAERKAK